MRFSGRLIGVFLAATTVTGTGGLAWAQDPSPADIIKMRQKDLKELGGALKAIGDQLKTGMPDKAITVPAANKALELSKELPNWFPKGTGPEAGVKTAAKPEIWSMPDEFKADADKLAPETTKLAAIVETGGVPSIGAQLQATGKVCGACHKEFRLKPPGE
jgi:cytochrome c556